VLEGGTIVNKIISCSYEGVVPLFEIMDIAPRSSVGYQDHNIAAVFASTKDVKHVALVSAAGVEDGTCW
jgi:hypothetical protein